MFERNSRFCSVVASSFVPFVETFVSVLIQPVVTNATTRDHEGYEGLRLRKGFNSEVRESVASGAIVPEGW